MNMSASEDTANNENAPIHFISERMENLQVPDNQPVSCPYFKDGKLFFNEPKLRSECHPSVANKILMFRSFRQTIEHTPEMYQQTIEIPIEYLDLIAALTQDSDEPCTVLASRINDLLSPFLRNENISYKFDNAIEKAIKQVAQKGKYGLKDEVYASIEHTTTTNIPWHLCITRWEVNDISILPIDIQQAIQTRRHSRQIMTEEFSLYIYNLTASDKSTIVNTKHRKNVTIHKEAVKIEDTNRQKLLVETDLEKEERMKKQEEEKKQRDEEKKIREERKQREEEKRKRKEEEKKLREEEKKKREEEKKKKEQSQLRLTSLFSKAANADIKSLPQAEKTIEPTNPTLFPAFYIKDNVSVVDMNQCSSEKPSTTTYDEFRNTIMQGHSVSLNSFLGEIRDSKQKRGISTHVDIRTLLLPGSANIMHIPNVRSALRMKLLQFQENVRPAYFGTFTLKSGLVTGRTPFVKDLDKLDYDMDSEAEWEPEGEGEDIHSGDEDEDDPNVDMIDPEDAGWLVPEGYLSDNEGLDEEEAAERILGKSSHATNSSKGISVRKIVLGPFFEGETDEDEILKPFETHLFIDVPAEGYNPFYKEPTPRSINVANIQTTNTTTSTSQPNNRTSEFTNEHKNALINVINEKSGDSIPNLISEAKANWLLKDVSKRQLEANIKNIAIKEKRGSDTKPTWYIKEPST